MRRNFAAVGAALSVLALAACAPSIPDSAAGVGFDNSINAQRQREAALSASSTGQPLASPLAVSDESAAVSSAAVPHTAPVQSTTLPAANTSSATSATTSPLAATAVPSTTPLVPATTSVPASSSSGTSDDIAAETAAVLAASSSNSGVEPLQASPSNPAPRQVSNPGISDENDFSAVSNRETIESDAERIAQNKAQYQQVAPTALPTRTGDNQPNIVQYALATSNPVGVRIYNRTGLNLQAKAARNCAAFPSPDQAQIAFLDAGGPQRDRRGLDPDGDGYACGWDPSPFRRAVQSGS